MCIFSGNSLRAALQKYIGTSYNATTAKCQPTDASLLARVGCRCALIATAPFWGLAAVIAMGVVGICCFTQKGRQKFSQLRQWVHAKLLTFWEGQPGRIHANNADSTPPCDGSNANAIQTTRQDIQNLLARCNRDDNLLRKNIEPKHLYVLNYASLPSSSPKDVDIVLQILIALNKNNTFANLFFKPGSGLLRDYFFNFILIKGYDAAGIGKELSESIQKYFTKNFMASLDNNALEILVSYAKPCLCGGRSGKLSGSHGNARDQAIAAIQKAATDRGLGALDEIVAKYSSKS
jgi:hypothetical protein